MWNVLYVVAQLSLAIALALAAVNPDPTPGSASGLMQIVNASLAAFTAIALCVKTYLDGRQARERRKWEAEDRRQRDRELKAIKNEVRLNTDVTAEIGTSIGHGNGLSDRIKAKLRRFYDLAPDAEPNDDDAGGPRTPLDVPPHPGHSPGPAGEVLPGTRGPAERRPGQ